MTALLTSASPLLAPGTEFISQTADVSQYAAISVTVALSPKGRHGELFLDFGPDGNTWVTSTKLTIADTSCTAYVPVNRYFRVRFENGSVMFTTFTMNVSGHDPDGVLAGIAEGRVTAEEIRDVVPELVRIISE